MNAKQYFLAILSAGLLSLSLAARADDIDIYAGLGSAANAPNLMFVIDTAANNDASFGPCNYDLTVLGDGAGGASSNSPNTLGNNQCALYNVTKFLPTRPITDPATGVVTQVALMKLGITTSDGMYFPLTPIDDNAYAGPATITLGGTTVSIPAGSTNRQAFLLGVKALYKHTSLVDYGDMMQETWAYYTGGDGTSGGINTAVGMISGVTYSGTTATSGCQKNYLVFIGATSSSSHVNDAGNALAELTAAVTLYENSLAASGVISTATANANITSLTTLIPNGINPDKYVYQPNGAPQTSPSSWAREWARFMYKADTNPNSAGTQNIVTYSISIGASGSVNVDQANFLHDMADFGGGKYYSVSSYSDLYNVILKILNEVQAVNSVFSSSSLPVSVNAQGTYLNQIYMGMFRPDEQADPRWTGNLKQYQFIYDTVTRTLHLGDSLGNLAISSSGTGFISPNAISFWTCTDLTTTPYLDTYVTTTLTSTQITLLKANMQNCADPANGKGFWASDPSAQTSLAAGFDTPDGERVERGGAAQRIRLFNLNDDYTTAAGSSTNSRNLYTYCPSGAGCVAALTDATNAFSITNGGILPAMFGTNVYINITSIVRNGNVATVTTAGAHGFNPGDKVTIANANLAVYNGTFTVTPTGPTTFTIPITESPPTPATGSYSVADNNLVTFYPLTSLMIVNRVIRPDGTVTAVVLGNTGTTNPLLAIGSQVTIQNATPANYDGTFTVTWAALNALGQYVFSYNITETPPAAAGSTSTANGNTTNITATAVGYTNASCKASATLSATVNLINTAVPSSSGAYRNPNSATPGTVTINTNTNISTWVAKCGVTLTNVVDNYGNAVAAYNGIFVPTTIGTTSFTISVAVAPVTPATAVTGTTMQAGGPTLLPVTLSLVDNAGANPPTATVTGSTGAVVNGFKVGDSIGIIDTPGVTTNPLNESAYKGAFTVSSVPSTTTFTYVINTTPPNPTALTGTTMTATRTTGFTTADMNNLINWVRGNDNVGDEYSLCPGGVAGTSASAIPGAIYANCPPTVATMRPSVHGDVLHSRPTVLNYGSYAVNITGTSDSGTVRTATASSADVTNITNAGATPVVTFANLQMCPVTVISATSFTYSTTNCGDPGAQVAHVGAKIVVFYGDNGGVFHAINGNQTATDFNGVGPGKELWGFIPKEMYYIKLARQRNNSPQLDLPSTPPGINPTPQGKDYFVDGATGVYQVIDGNGNTTRAVLYLSMRRGGNFIYAIDVTDPTKPTVLWRVDSTSPGMSELGQTWSQPKVAWVRGYSTNIDPLTGQAVPVVFFGGGYDTNEDNEPEVAADTKGRAIFALDALTGTLVWEVTTAGGGATSCGVGTTCLMSGMDYAIPADITMLDRNSDGYIDRLYAADLGGNIWRVDLEPGCNSSYPCVNSNPSHWFASRLARLGCNTGVCANPASPTQRKFFYPPEVIQQTATDNYDAVIAGSGDREHPLQVSSTSQSANALYLLKDFAVGDDATKNPVLPPPSSMSMGSLFNATTTPWDGSLLGYYIYLGLGEKVVNAPLAVAGYVYLSTNTPPSPTANSCISALGTAKGYQLSPFAGTFQTVVFDGGGLPPSPVAGIVNIVVGDQVKQVPFIIGAANPNCTGPDCSSALGGQKPIINVPTTRHRNYWYIKGK